ncbi:MAG: helix-turn-helix domain-containing protein [Ruminiclostridium sp.]|nr:helix-turn-helix domain-containing protein [Ruminiclostridium sp.]
MLKKSSDNTKNKFYAKILLCFVIVVVSTIFILSAILYINFEKIILNTIYSSQIENLLQISDNTDMMYQSIKTLSLQLYFDNDVSRLRNLANPEISDISLAASRLRMNGAIIPYIQSIYVYSDKANIFYSATPYGSFHIYREEEFFDKDIIDILNRYKDSPTLYPIIRKLPYISNSYETTVSNGCTFLFYDSKVGIKPTEGALIINMSEAWIRNLIEQQSKDINIRKSIFIIDKKGDLIASNNMLKLPADLTGQNYIKNVVDARESYGYYVESFDNVKSLVVYATYEPFNWRFISVIPYSDIVNDVNRMKYNTIIIGFIILFSSIILSIILLKKAYHPINKVVSRLSNLESEMSKTFYNRKQEYLKNIILGKIIDNDDTVRNNINAFKTNFDYAGNFTILYFMIDHYYDFCSNNDLRDRNLLKYAIMNIISDICLPFFINEPADMGEDHIVLLCNVINMTPQEFAGPAGSVIKSIQSSVNQALQISLSVVTCPLINDITAVNRLYNIAQKASTHRIYLGHGCVISSEDYQHNEAAAYEYSLENDAKLKELLMLGHIQQAQSLFKEIIMDTENDQYSFFHLTLFRLASTFYTVLYTIKNNSGIPLPYNFNNIITNLNRLETIQEICDYFYSLFECIANILEERKNIKHDDIIKKVEEIIQADYSNMNLSLENISDSIDMSPAYLGRLFKKITSQSIVDYINEVRMKKAKDLLTNTNITINEIVSNTGYTNIQYFYKVFKKTFGVTPNNFRKNNIQ